MTHDVVFLFHAALDNVDNIWKLRLSVGKVKDSFAGMAMSSFTISN